LEATTPPYKPVDTSLVDPSIAGMLLAAPRKEGWASGRCAPDLCVVDGCTARGNRAIVVGNHAESPGRRGSRDNRW
jgi:hypothetical protein